MLEVSFIGRVRTRSEIQKYFFFERIFFSGAEFLRVRKIKNREPTFRTVLIVTNMEFRPRPEKIGTLWYRYLELKAAGCQSFSLEIGRKIEPPLKHNQRVLF